MMNIKGKRGPLLELILMMGVLIFLSGAHQSFASSSFGKTAEEMEAEARGNRGGNSSSPRTVTRKNDSLSQVRRGVPFNNLRLKDSLLRSHIVCDPHGAIMMGGTRLNVLSMGRPVIGCWDQRGAAAAWVVDVPEPGDYVIEMTYGSRQANGVKVIIQVGDQEKRFNLEKTRDGDDLSDDLGAQTCVAGEFRLTQGSQRVTLWQDQEISSAFHLNSLRIIPKKDYSDGIKLYPEIFQQLHGKIRLDRNNMIPLNLSVLWDSDSLEDFIKWRVDIPKSGRYKVEVDFFSSSPKWRACLKLGSDAELTWEVPPTMNDGFFIKTLGVGECFLNAGDMMIEVCSKDKPQASFRMMDVYAIRLIPFDGQSDAPPLDSSIPAAPKEGEMILMPQDARCLGWVNIEKLFGHLAGFEKPGRDEAIWGFQCHQEGEYDIEVEYAVITGRTVPVQFKCGREILTFDPQPTEGWNKYLSPIVGRMKIEKGYQSLAVSVMKRGGAFNINKIRLIPVSGVARIPSPKGAFAATLKHSAPPVNAVIDGANIPEPVRKLIRAYSMQKKALLAKAQESYANAIRDKQKQYAESGKFDEVAKLQNSLKGNVDFEGEGPTEPEAKQLFVLSRNELKPNLSVLRDRYVALLKKFRSQCAEKNDFATVASLQPVIQNPDSEVVFDGTTQNDNGMRRLRLKE